jgi:hypothetical protein
MIITTAKVKLILSKPVSDSVEIKLLKNPLVGLKSSAYRDMGLQIMSKNKTLSIINLNIERRINQCYL